MIEDADSGVYTEKESWVEPTGMASEGPELSSWREEKRDCGDGDGESAAAVERKKNGWVMTPEFIMS